MKLFLALCLTTVILLAGIGKLVITPITQPHESQNLVPAPAGYLPDLVIIETSQGWGSGALVETELGVGVVGVDHVMAEDMIITRQSDGSIITWDNLVCQRPTGDSTCFASVNLSHTNIIRNVQSPLPQEFVIWDKDRQIWLPFRLDPNSRCGEGTFCIIGQDVVIDGVLQKAKVRPGMSGASVFAAHEGKPLINSSGQFISRGELVSGISGNFESILGVIFSTEF